MLDKGTTVAGYRIDGALGEGGMGVVYRATQISLNRSVALKILSSDLGDDEGFRERFRREGLLQAAIDHPHIVTVYDTGETEHGLFLAMRMVRGPTLKDMILARELDPARTLRILKQVSEALDTAHDVGLTHRDIKPQNILIGSRDHAYLADFGLTKAPDEDGRLTATGQFVGTIDYVSPEQIQGEAATARSDIYALTGVLFECLVGSVPYPKPAEAAVVYAHISEPPPRPTEHRAELPESVDEVVARGMAKDPDERFRSAGELLHHAELAFGFVAETGEQAPPAGPAPGGRGGRGNGAPTEPAGDLRTPDQLAGQVTSAREIQAAPTIPSEVPGTQPAAPTRDERAERSRPVPLPAIALVLAVLAAVAGFALGGSGDSESVENLGSSASAGALAVSFPDDWKRVAGATRIPGLALSDPIAVAPTNPPGARFHAGETDGVGPTLLPEGFLARLPRPPERDDTVKLGRLQALRYVGLTPEGTTGRVTVYAAPTTRGVATVACAAPPTAAAKFAADCERVAGTLQLTEGKPLPAGPRAEYAKAVARGLDGLDGAARPARRRLRAAKTPTAQARAAAGLRNTYRRAARRVAAAQAGPYERAAHARVVAALRTIASGYGDAASAARSGRKSSYAAAGRAVRGGGKKLRAGLRNFASLGYTLDT